MGAAVKAVLSGTELELERELEHFLIKRKAKYSTEGFSVSLAGFGTSLVKQHGSLRGSDVRQVPPLAPIGSLPLLPTGSDGSKNQICPL